MVKVRFLHENHGHDWVDGFGHIAMSSWMRSSYWRLKEMVAIGAQAHKKRDVTVDAFVAGDSVRASLPAQLQSLMSYPRTALVVSTGHHRKRAAFPWMLRIPDLHCMRAQPLK